MRRGVRERRQSTSKVVTLLLAVAVAVIPAAMWTTADAIGVVKWTLLVLVAIGIAAVLAIASIRGEGTKLYERRAFVLLAVFLGAVALVAITSDSAWLALVGDYTFYQGAITFVGLSILLVAVLSVERDPTGTLLRATTIGAGLVALLTAGQFVGIEWANYEPRMFGRVVTTLGNSNFGSAYLALTLPAILHQTVSSNRSAPERIGSGAVGVLVAVEAIAIGSAQGSITAGVAVAAWLVLLGLIHLGVRRTVAALCGAIALSGVAVLVAWSRVYGELADSVRIGRQGAWLSAWAQFKAHPVLGVGLDHFGRNFPAYRPAFSAAREGERFTNAGQAHNVILDLFADGGVVLGASYLALILYTGYRGFRGLRRLYLDGRSERYFQLAAVVAVWLAYQVQAQVSIDHVPLAVMHWIFMALILRISYEAEGREPLSLGQRRQQAEAKPAAVIAVATVALLLFWIALVPFRADRAAGALKHADSQQHDQLIGKLELATSLMPFRSYYWLQLGLQVQARDGAQEAAPYIQRGAELDEGNTRVAMLVAQYYAAIDAPDIADAWWRRTLARDPFNPDLLREAITFYSNIGDDGRVSALRLRLSSLPPEETG